MGTGEVTRYLSACGSERVSTGVLVSPIPPFFLQTDDNPNGVPGTMFDGFVEDAKADMPAWMKAFLENFFSTGSTRDPGVRDEVFQANWNLDHHVAEGDGRVYPDLGDRLPRGLAQGRCAPAGDPRRRRPDAPD
jgi:hypothetical protein